MRRGGKRASVLALGLATADTTTYAIEDGRGFAQAARMLRPAVGTRKMCGGGNRTPRGAHSQQVLASVLRTAQQRGLDSTGVLVALQAPRPVVLDAFQPMLH